MGSTPGFVVGTFGSDNAADGHEHSVIAFVSIFDLKLESATQVTAKETFEAYPKVAPEPSMNFPRVRITPLGPAPYWKIETAPKKTSQNGFPLVLFVIIAYRR